MRSFHDAGMEPPSSWPPSKLVVTPYFTHNPLAECYGVAVWRGNVLATVCTASLLLAATVFADERGWLLGSAGFFGKQFLGDAAKATIIVECRGKTTTIQTDERGDYAVSAGRVQVSPSESPCSRWQKASNPLSTSSKVCHHGRWNNSLRPDDQSLT